MFGQALLAKLGALALVLAAVFGIGWHAGGKSARSALAAEKTAHAETQRENAEKWKRQAELTAKAVEAAREREVEVRKLLDAANEQREQGIAHAVESQQELVADLRAGTVRLREQWRGCQAAAAVSADAATEPSTDAGAELRAEAAGRIARVGDDADIQVRGLQAYARACQSLTRDEE